MPGRTFEQALRERLEKVPADRVIFVGVGNRLRGDDAIGPEIIDLIAEKVPHAIDAGTTPEDLTSAIKRLKPKVIVFVDALRLEGLKPGTATVLESADIRHLGSSHVLSLDTIIDYLKGETGADVFLIGVQPGSVEDREGLSAGMEGYVGRIAEIIRQAVRTVV